jgi:hypothetical protein
MRNDCNLIFSLRPRAVVLLLQLDTLAVWDTVPALVFRVS